MIGSRPIFWRKSLRGGIKKTTLFIHRSKGKLLVAQIDIDDIVFKATSSDLGLSFTKEMKTKF